MKEDMTMINYSTITTVFNDSESVEKFIHNMESQTLQPVELILVDGGSKDNTVSIIQDLTGKSSLKIKCLSGKRLNISQGFNEGIRNVCTPWVAVVTTGNYYEEFYFEKLAKEIETKNIDFAYSPYKGQDNTKVASSYNKLFLNNNRGCVLDIASNHGVLMKKEIFEKIGYFYENFVYAGEDAELYTKLKKSEYKGSCVMDANVFWDTPRTFKEYERQVRVYTIAKMQMNSWLKVLFYEKRHLVYITSFILGIVLLFIPRFSPVGAMIFCSWTIYAMYLTIRYGGVYTRLKFESILLPLYYMIKEFKYFSKEYKVDDNNRYKKGEE